MGIAQLPYMLMIANYIGSLTLLRILHPFRMTLIRFLTGARRVKWRSMLRNVKLWELLEKRVLWLGTKTLTGKVWIAYIYKDLGLLTSSNLLWNSHIDSITARANGVLGLVKRTCKDFKDITTTAVLLDLC